MVSDFDFYRKMATRFHAITQHAAGAGPGAYNFNLSALPKGGIYDPLGDIARGKAFRAAAVPGQYDQWLQQNAPSYMRAGGVSQGKVAVGIDPLSGGAAFSGGEF